MTKMNSNLPALSKYVKEYPWVKFKQGEVTINNVTYNIIDVQKTKWSKGELFCRRLLGVFLTGITFGIFYAKNRDWFSKYKEIKVIAEISKIQRVYYKASKPSSHHGDVDIPESVSKEELDKFVKMYEKEFGYNSADLVRKHLEDNIASTKKMPRSLPRFRVEPELMGEFISKSFNHKEGHPERKHMVNTLVDYLLINTFFDPKNFITSRYCSIIDKTIPDLKITELNSALETVLERRPHFPAGKKYMNLAPAFLTWKIIQEAQHGREVSPEITPTTEIKLQQWKGKEDWDHGFKISFLKWWDELPVNERPKELEEFKSFLEKQP